LVYSWISSGTAKPYIEFTWPEVKKINRIDLYDRSSNVDFKTARIQLFSGATQVLSGDINVIANGSKTTTGFAITNADRLRTDPKYKQYPCSNKLWEQCGQFIHLLRSTTAPRNSWSGEVVSHFQTGVHLSIFNLLTPVGFR
jgi:hypothetical protein